MIGFSLYDTGLVSFAITSNNMALKVKLYSLTTKGLQLELIGLMNGNDKNIYSKLQGHLECTNVVEWEFQF